MTGNTANTPLPVGPIWKLSVTTTPTSAATKLALNTKSYHGLVVGGIRARQNGRTMTLQAVNITTLRTDAGQAVQWTRLSTRTATSQIASARDMLSHIGRRWAVRT